MVRYEIEEALFGGQACTAWAGRRIFIVSSCDRGIHRRKKLIRIEGEAAPPYAHKLTLVPVTFRVFGDDIGLFGCR